MREVTGVFPSRDALETAVGGVLEAGIDRADIDIMAGVDAVVEKLGGIYAPAHELADVPEAPRRFFRAREDVTVPLAGAAGILTYIGATAAALGVVASGGALAAVSISSNPSSNRSEARTRRDRLSRDGAAVCLRWLYTRASGPQSRSARARRARAPGRGA